jgi:hypothetical protein
MAERRKPSSRAKPAAKKKAAKKAAAKKPAAKKPAVKEPVKKGPAKKTRSTKAATPKQRVQAPKSKQAPKAAAKPAPEPAKLDVTPPAPKPKPAEPQLPSLKRALEWVGMKVDGVDGDKLGTLAGIHVDVSDRKPRWAIVKLGRLAGCTALPYDHVAEGGDRLFAAYERRWVKEAPRFKPDEALSADQELELCAHWGIRLDKARSAEVKGRKPDEISAVPAEA